MKRIISKMRYQTILPLLVMAVLLTLPYMPTDSKYAWEDTIMLELKVSNPEQSITSVGTEGHPSEFWVLDFTNIQAVPTEDGLLLAAEDGYTLPEYITVEIGQAIFSVKTDGTEAPESIDFEPAAGLLSIAKSLIEENPGGVTVRAAAAEETSTDSMTPVDDMVSAGDTASVGRILFSVSEKDAFCALGKCFL